MARKQDDSPVGSDPDLPTIYPITVDYGRTLAEMVEAGHYDYANGYINADSFPFTGDGAVALDCVLVHLGRSTITEKVESEIAGCSLRPARLEELLAFGEACPEVQREFPVVELGSGGVRSIGDRDVAYLWDDAGRRTRTLLLLVKEGLPGNLVRNGHSGRPWV